MVFNSLIGQFIQLAGADVFFDLAIPLLCVELGEPLAESSQIIRRELRHSHFDVVKGAHTLSLLADECPSQLRFHLIVVAP